MPGKSLFNIPHELLRNAVRASGAKTKTEAVILGLKELIRQKHARDFMRLAGSGSLGVTRLELAGMRRR